MIKADDDLWHDNLALAPTRPRMMWGVSYTAFTLNLVLTAEGFIWSKSLLFLLVAVPVHGIFYLLCLWDAHIFDLLGLWCRTKGLSYLGRFAGFGNFNHFKSGSYSAFDYSTRLKPLPIKVRMARRRQNRKDAKAVKVSKTPIKGQAS